MELYTRVSHQVVLSILKQYSTSFGAASRLLSARNHAAIADIYALVRIADEVVDTYDGPDRRELLEQLEARVYDALERGYSSDIVVHAFAQTARQYDINVDLITPFFESMLMDVDPPDSFTQAQYDKYIYGSAEVVGLMCLRVFMRGKKDTATYEPAARALGSAFQKVNFLRDLADDNSRLGRYYFPVGSYATFDDHIKDTIVQDIQSELLTARKGCLALPNSSKYGVALALVYFDKLAEKLAKTPAATVTRQRVRIDNVQKLGLLLAMLTKKMLGLRPL